MIQHFHTAARDEFSATVDYYEDALAGLGAQFRDAVKATLERIDAYPHSGRETRDGFRRGPATFPAEVTTGALEPSA